jgi:predicted regulator of Ras-like GTPase activity (Roadblock/LC7/MglB family)
MCPTAGADAQPNLLKALRLQSGVKHAFLVSKTGHHLGGQMPKMADNTIFPSLISIAHGAAEQLGRECDDHLSYSMLVLNEELVVIMTIDERTILGLVLSDEADMEKIMSIVETH